MDWKLERTDTAQKDMLEASRYPEVRLLDLNGSPTGKSTFNQDQLNKTEPESFYDYGGWDVTSSTTVGSFSGVGYLFGKYLNQELDIPIGLIDVSVGGTSAESFIDLEKIEKEKDLWPIYPKYRDTDNWLDNPIIAEWCRGRARKNLSNWFESPTNPMPHHRYEPAFLFESGLKPLLPSRIKGAIWYLGRIECSCRR